MKITQDIGIRICGTGSSVPERAFRQWKPLCIWQKRQQHCRRTEQHCWNV